MYLGIECCSTEPDQHAAYSLSDTATGFAVPAFSRDSLNDARLLLDCANTPVRERAAKQKDAASDVERRFQVGQQAAQKYRSSPGNHLPESHEKWERRQAGGGA